MSAGRPALQNIENVVWSENSTGTSEGEAQPSREKKRRRVSGRVAVAVSDVRQYPPPANGVEYDPAEIMTVLQSAGTGAERKKIRREVIALGFVPCNERMLQRRYQDVKDGMPHRSVRQSHDHSCLRVYSFFGVHCRHACLNNSQAGTFISVTQIPWT